MRIFSNPDMQNAKNCIPDIEVFYNDDEVDPMMLKGWFWQYCCESDSDAFGPFLTKEDAIDHARSLNAPLTRD